MIKFSKILEINLLGIVEGLFLTMMMEVLHGFGRNQLFHLEQEKRKTGEILDNLDIFSDDYGEQYAELQERIDLLYDNIEDAEHSIELTMRKLESLKKGIKATEQLQRVINELPELFENMSCAEKRDAFRLYIDRIEMYPEGADAKRIIKSISFKFPVFYEDYEPHVIMTPDEIIQYTIETSEVDVTAAEAKATYAQLKSYILEEYDMKVSTLYIAQMKRKYGLEIGQSYNKPENPGKRTPKCPLEKEKAIVAALKHFKMLDDNIQVTKVTA